MSVTVFNTLSRRKERLKPLSEGVVRLFVCGPTVYDWAHIGHAKTYTQFDLIVRYLRWRGFKVQYLQNITDIDDKIIARASRDGVSVEELTALYEARYRKDMEALDNTSVDVYARASAHVDQVVDQVSRLIELGNAYELPDGIYFDIKTFPDYGKLSGRQSIAPEDAISRVDENPLKRHPGDFALWKRRKPGEPFWDTPLGPGRPGWHIEDTAITEHFFGPQYDVHGGAVDLIFPHHEAEIAQMESASGRAPLAKYWLHTGFLNIDNTKMSKSLGNAFTVHRMLEDVEPRLLRFFLLSYHYRSAIEYTEDLLDNARGALRRIENFYQRLPEGDERMLSPEVAEARKQIIGALDDDFDTPAALAGVFSLIRSQNRGASAFAGSRALLEDLDQIFRFLPARPRHADLSLNDMVTRAIAERETLRRERRFDEADMIRDHLRSQGIVLEDTPDGVRWHKLAGAHGAV